MRRPVLLTLVVLGMLISLIGSTGLFAALTDTARTGTNSVDSAELASSADIQLADAADGPDGVACGTFSENLETAFITASDVENGWVLQQYFCIRNIGSQSVSLSAIADELTDVDTFCTGDEEEYDDATCGGGLAGELSGVLQVGYSVVDCETGVWGYIPMTLAANATAEAGLGDLAAGAEGCYWLTVYYSSSDADAVQAAQSDTVTWRFEFIAEA
jgi:hypothetical protein